MICLVDDANLLKISRYDITPRRAAKGRWLRTAAATPPRSTSSCFVHGRAHRLLRLSPSIMWYSASIARPCCVQAVALAAREQGLASLIVMPENAPPVKVRAWVRARVCV
jgi:hypothetical protein